MKRISVFAIAASLLATPAQASAPADAVTATPAVLTAANAVDPDAIVLARELVTLIYPLSDSVDYLRTSWAESLDSIENVSMRSRVKQEYERSLNRIEQVMAWKVTGPLDRDQLSTRLMRRAARYDKSGDEHYNLISALHKSIRGSDPDAALYWFNRMLLGGEDPRFLARRLTRMAVEDIGLADPQANGICLDAWNTYERLGSPEGELALAQAVIYLALAPKSNAGYTAYKQSAVAAKKTGSEPPPKHILNAPTKLMEEQGYGDGYLYDHDSEDAFSGQNYFPDGMKRGVYYTPVERGFERELKKRVEWFAGLRAKRGAKRDH